MAEKELRRNAEFFFVFIFLSIVYNIFCMRIPDQEKRISEIMRKWLFILMIVAFILSILVLGFFQTILAQENAKTILSTNVQDVKHDITDASDENLLKLAETVKFDYEHRFQIYSSELTDNSDSVFMDYMCELYDLNDVLEVNNKGIITASSDRSFIGFDMNSGEQSAEFLCLLGDQESYVQSYGPISIDESQYRKFAGVKLAEGGFLQVSYDAARFRRDIDGDVEDVTQNRHVGQEGFIIIISENGDVVSSPYTETNGGNINDYNGVTTQQLETRLDGKPFITNILGISYICMEDKVEGYYIFAAMPRSEVLMARDFSIIVIAVLEALIFLVIFRMIYTLTKRLVIDNINEVAQSLDRIVQGDLDVVVDVRGNKEFDALSDDINQTVGTLKDHIAAEAARLDAELEYAKSIQQSALPSVFPPYPDHNEFDIHATMAPAKEVGGDFFDFELLEGNRFGFCIADVSGKGIPAALFMMRAKTLIKSFGIAGLPPEEILRRVNDELCANNSAGMFVTCWLGILDLNTGIIEYANAGHNPPLIRHGNGQFEFLRNNPNFVLAGMEGIKYRHHELKLYKDDVLFLYTDGVTEATDNGNNLFGDDRLMNTLNSITFSSMEDICEKVRHSVDMFVGTAPQFDDITMLSLIYNGSFAEDTPDVITMPAILANHNEFMAFIEQQLESMDCPMKDLMKIEVAVDEIFANVASYAYPDSSGNITAKVEKLNEPAGVRIAFSDNGIPFNPLDLPDPDTDLPVEQRSIGGLGIYMIKKSMDNVSYRYEKSKNIFTIVKYFEGR